LVTNLFLPKQGLITLAAVSPERISLVSETFLTGRPGVGKNIGHRRIGCGK
jgi:hypothetical protein